MEEFGISTYTWKLNDTYLYNSQVKKKSYGKFEKALNRMKTKAHHIKIYEVQPEW